jgi:hypothetical protein
MKKAFRAVLVLALAVFSVFSILKIIRTRRIANGPEIKILLVFNPTTGGNEDITLQAYRSVLQEEGFPFQEVGATALLSLSPEDVLRSTPAIVFPDGAAAHLPMEMRPWIERYVRNGGSAAFIYDAGTRDVKGRFLDEGLFAGTTGINAVTYKRFQDRSYTLGHIKFLDRKSQELFQVPSGKLQEGLLLGGYAYGTLEYPMARTAYLRAVSAEEIYATVETLDGEPYPAIVLSGRGLGRTLYVNMPLGFVKCYSDDFPLRSVLRTFLGRIVKMPRLLGVRRGRGGLVVNWHIDSSIDWKSLPAMLKDGYLVKDLKYSLDVTAGDFRDAPGDGLGFDACGKGRPFLELLRGFGTIGSHGGWGHNWFADGVGSGAFTKAEIAENIRRNSVCLESVTGAKVVEYAAPAGIHPQPMTTDILEKQGFLAYYYTGDAGSAPNRTFLNGKKISDKVLAFPIMPLGKSASFHEMKTSGVAEAEVEKWLTETTDYVIRNRTIRLIYSHPYDIPDYPRALKSFLQYAARKQKEGGLEVDSMTDFARFLLRFLKTEFAFARSGAGLVVTLRNPEGLDGVTFAVPRSAYARPESPGLAVQADEDYFYAAVEGDARARTIVVKAR